MKKEELLKVVSDLIGDTKPYADTRIDEVRYENQEKMIELVMNGVENLIENSKYKTYPAYSVEKIGSRAYEVLEEVHRLIEDVL